MIRELKEFLMANLLVIGGSGHVGSLVLPALSAVHQVRVFDLKPPISAESVTYINGNVCDPAALDAVCEGMDALLYMAMGPADWSAPSLIAGSFDANVKGVYLALEAAHRAGIQHAVYTSSMSVYDGNLFVRHFHDEDITPDSTHVYGFTKLLGEECCRTACRAWGMSVNALRLCLPQAEEKWLAETRIGTPTIATTAADVAAALIGAIEYAGHGFNAFMISGDYEQKLMNMQKARRLLGWAPQARPIS
jgi:nucleoside-diphosphate-sugar epimerase